MNRIDQRFARLKAERQKGLILYIGAGDPDLEATRRLALEFDQLGVDVLELGVPFSDPLADGPVNQLAAQRGLASGTTPPGVLATVAAIRRQSEIPIVLYIYFNLAHRYGLRRFIEDAARAGVDGLLVLDLPPEEAGSCLGTPPPGGNPVLDQPREEGGSYQALMRQAGLCPIYLVAPTTPEARIELIVKGGAGFIYYVCREGVTGMQTEVARNIAQMTAKIRAHTSLPIAVGFGISTPEQARTVAAHAQAVVIGSAIVNQIAQLGRDPALVSRVAEFVKPLAAAVKS
jgi:tryptophan synthase alpha chain